jgi:hypothetical protein
MKEKLLGAALLDSLPAEGRSTEQRLDGNRRILAMAVGVGAEAHAQTPDGTRYTFVQVAGKALCRR